MMTCMLALMCLVGTIRTRFILTNTHHPGNVGAAARAMKTMGFNELALVTPRDPKVLNRKRTKDGASGAGNVLDETRLFESLPDALEGIDVWCATGMPNDMSLIRGNQEYHEPRVYFQELLSKVPNSKDIKSIAFVFGNERVGMTDEDMEYCHLVVGIPTNPEFGSLNLASAVQLIAYDWRQALGGFTAEDKNEFD
jgi:tRNA/rRNA methyltransferase